MSESGLPKGSLEEENRSLRFEVDALREEVAVLRVQAKSDMVELAVLRETVRRLNNEAMAAKAGVAAPQLSRTSSTTAVQPPQASPPAPSRNVTNATSTMARSPRRDDSSNLKLVQNDEEGEESEEAKSPRGAGFFNRFRNKQVSPRSNSADKGIPNLSPPSQASSLAAAGVNTSTTALPVAALASAFVVSSPTNGRVGSGQTYDSGFAVSILSAKKVGRNMFFLLGYRRSKGDEFIIVPRLYQHFRELHAALVKEFGEVVVPELRKPGATEKETQVLLQTYLDHISHFEETAVFPAFRDEFLDPLFAPSFYTLREVLKAVRHGPMQVTLALHKPWKQHVCVLLDSLYIFRSEEDVSPVLTLDLEWITIELVTLKQEGAPPFVFKICNLENATETFVGCDSTKEVGEWILALREAKVRKKGDGFWVGSSKEDSLVLPESVVKRRQELEAGFVLFRQWLEKKDKSLGAKHSVMQMALQLDATPIPINFEQESRTGGSKSAAFRARGEEGVLQIVGGSRQRFLALLLSCPPEEVPEPSAASVVPAASSLPASSLPGSSSLSAATAPTSAADRDKGLEDIDQTFGSDAKFEDLAVRSPLSPQLKKPLPAPPKEDRVDTSLFLDQFVLVYRLFLGTNELFLTIVSRFMASSDDAVRRHCCVVIQKLIQYHWCEVARDPTLARLVLEFVSSSIESRYPDVFRGLRDSIALHAQEDKRAQKQWLKTAPKALLPDMYQRHTFDFIDLNPVEVARQLTILEHNLFSAIEGRELLNQCWNKDNKEMDAPNVTLTIRRFNQMSGWIASLIVKVKPLKPRVALLRRFIDIADACKHLNNFNSVVEIVSGLQTTAVRRLTDTFDALPAETAEVLQQLREFLETRKNWEKYRSSLSGLFPVVGVACVPYLGLYLTDLVMIDEALKKTIPHPEFPDVSLLNWERASRIAAVHSEIRRFQAERYRLNSISYLQEYLSRLDQMSEEECYERSLLLQPRKN